MVIVSVVLAFMVVIVMIVMIVVIIVIVMVIMMVVVMVTTSCGSQSSDVSNSNHVDISDLLITIEPSRELEPSALLNIPAIDDVVVHFTN
jgi:ABC-type lipoprotein release transport system permease subunit